MTLILEDLKGFHKTITYGSFPPEIKVPIAPTLGRCIPNLLGGQLPTPEPFKTITFRRIKMLYDEVALYQEIE